MKLLKSKTTQNVAVTGGVAGFLIVILQRVWPGLAEDQALQDALIILINTLGLPIVSRLLAFVRNPEKAE